MKTIKTGDNDTYQVEVADNLWSKFKGLYFRESGKKLFIFNNKTSAKVNMAFMKKDLYLYFIDENGEVLEIEKAEPWGANPKTWKFYKPEQKYKYLLESFEKCNLEKGDKLIINE